MTGVRTVMVVLAITVMSSGCVQFTSTGPTTLTEPTREVSDALRELAALAFISRAGQALEGTEAEIDEILIGCIETELERQRVVSGKYDLIWGPATFKFKGSLYDDNMMYVVAETENPSRLVVVVRGTNAFALKSWLKEDLAVQTQVEWPYPPDDGPVPKLSKATHVGLTVLQNMTARSKHSSEALSVRDYLRERVKHESLSRVTVVGHSLGGALAPALALWLRQTEDEWQGGGVQISVTALAGATPGDQTFAAYYDRILGRETGRVFNPYDIVPQAWDTDTMRTIPHLYADAKISANWLERLLVSGAIDSVTGMGYRQLMPSSPSLKIAIMPSENSFLGQAGWQHRCGYECALDLGLQLMSSDCKIFAEQASCDCPGL